MTNNEQVMKDYELYHGRVVAILMVKDKWPEFWMATAVCKNNGGQNFDDYISITASVIVENFLDGVLPICVARELEETAMDARLTALNRFRSHFDGVTRH